MLFIHSIQEAVTSLHGRKLLPLRCSESRLIVEKDSRYSRTKFEISEIVRE